MSELTQRIKAKYPQYANVPDQELEKRVLAKYPQYKQYAGKSIGGFVENVGKSTVGAVKDIGGSLLNVLNPDMEKNTLANLAKLGIDTAKLVGGDKSELNRASQVLNFYKQRYGGVDNIGETIYNDPMGFLLDASVVLGGAGAVAKGVGAATKASGISRVGSALSTASTFTDPFMLAGKAAKASTKNVFSKTASKLNSTADDIATRGIGNPVAQAKAAKKAGRSVASFIDEYDLYDRSPESASGAKTAIINQYDDLAFNSGKSVEMKQIVEAFNSEIDKLSQGVGGVVSDADKSKIAELARRRDQVIQATGGMVDAQGQLISSPVRAGVDTLTNVRRKVIDPDVPQSMFGLDAKGSGSAQGVKKSRDIVKGAIDSSDARLKKLGRDYGMAKEVEKIFEQSQSRANNRQMFNFTKLGSAGIGSVVAGAPGVVAGFATEQVLNSPQFARAASKSMRKAAKSLPTFGKNVSKGAGFAKTGYNTGKSTRVFTPDQRKSRSTNTQTKPRLAQEPVPYQPIISPTANTPFGNTKQVKKGSFY
jgi:hypothetical protein